MYELRYNKTNGNLRHRPLGLLDIFLPHFGETIFIGLTTSTPVTISTGIILDRSQIIDAGPIIQVERNEKALRRIQEKIMRARSTLDWSQSNNIS